MTVLELIDELQKIEDKELEIMYEDNEYGEMPIEEIMLINTQSRIRNPKPHFLII